MKYYEVELSTTHMEVVNCRAKEVIDKVENFVCQADNYRDAEVQVNSKLGSRENKITNCKEIDKVNYNKLIKEGKGIK